MRQITAGCHPGSSVALLSAERNGVNADKHCRVIYYTSIKKVPIHHQQERRLSLSQGHVCVQAAQHVFWSLLFTYLQILKGMTVNSINICLLNNCSLVWLHQSIHSLLSLLELKQRLCIPGQLTSFVVFPSHIRH